MTVSSRLARIAFGAAVVVIAGFLLLPTIIIFPMSFSAASDASQFPPAAYSFKWYESVLTDPAWQSATLTSLKASCLTVICSVVLGTSAALALFHSRFAGKFVVGALLMSPLVTPVIVFAIGIFMVFSRWRMVGTMTGLVAANTVLSTPFVVASVTATLHTLNPNLELASAGLGAGPWRTFWRVTLPLIFPGVMAGAIFAFIASWDEVVVAIFLTSPSLRTLPVLIWSGVRGEISPAVAAVGSILIMISAIGMIAVHLITKGVRR